MNIKALAIILFTALLPTGLVAQPYLVGKVRIVSSFPDYKVKVVNSFPDLKVKVVEGSPSQEGEWKFVDSFEDFSIQYVDSFEDFKVQFVNSFPGKQNKTVSCSNNTNGTIQTTKKDKGDSSSNVNTSSEEYLEKEFYKLYGYHPWPVETKAESVIVEKDSFSVERLPNRKFPIHARVKIVDSVPDLIIRNSSGDAFPDLKITISETLDSEHYSWQIVDTLPDFTIMFYPFWRFCDMGVDILNYYSDEQIHKLILEHERMSESRYPDPDIEAPLPTIKKKTD